MSEDQDRATARLLCFRFRSPGHDHHSGLVTKGQLTSNGRNGGTCYFAETGTYSYAVVGSQSTGKFAGATGSGTGTTTVVLGANMLPGKTTCSVSNTSDVITKGASITFKLSGPLTLK